MVALEESIEFVESTLHRMKSSRGSQMPFTKKSRSVAERLQPISNRDFIQRKAGVAMHFQQADVELVSESLLIAASHQSGSAGTAVWSAHVGIGEADAGPGERIDVWRGDVLLPWTPMSAYPMSSATITMMFGGLTFVCVSGLDRTQPTARRGTAMIQARRLMGIPRHRALACPVPR